MRAAWGIAIAVLLGLGGCAAEPDSGARYRSELEPTTGSRVSGWVSFDSMGDHVHVKAEVRGLTPGQHGFHVHEIGDCSSGDGKSAGGHFNPGAAPHAGPDAPARHMGDLGNLEADASGLAVYERMDFGLRMTGADSILGRAVIVHERADDLVSQPTGNAGARLACGVIVEAP